MQSVAKHLCYNSPIVFAKSFFESSTTAYLCEGTVINFMILPGLQFRTFLKQLNTLSSADGQWPVQITEHFNC